LRVGEGADVGDTERPEEVLAFRRGEVGADTSGDPSMGVSEFGPWPCGQLTSGRHRQGKRPASWRQKTRQRPRPRKTKEGLGKVTGDEELEAEGKGDQAKGNLKQAGEKVEDAFKK
jgi:hypothetical protein